MLVDPEKHLSKRMLRFLMRTRSLKRMKKLYWLADWGGDSFILERSLLPTIVRYIKDSQRSCGVGEPGEIFRISIKERKFWESKCAEYRRYITACRKGIEISGAGKE